MENNDSLGQNWFQYSIKILISISLLGPLPKDFTYRGSPSNPSSPASVKEPDSPDLTPPPSPAHTTEPLLQRTSNYPNNGTYSMLKKSKGMVQTLFGDSLLSYNSPTFSNVRGSSSIWTNRILNICFDFFSTAAACRNNNKYSILKIRHV